MSSVNIASHLPRLAQQQPDVSAVTVQCSGGKYKSMSYASLDAESDIMARGLQALGISKGTRTVLMVKPGLDFFVLVFALFKIGAVLVAVDPGMGMKNLSECLQEAGPEAFIGVRTAHMARICLGWARSSIHINIVVEERRILGQIMTGLAAVRLAASGSTHPAMNETYAGDMAAILFTSGSTGAPKGVVYRHRNFTAQVDAIRNLYGIEPGEIDLATFPLFALFAPALGMTAVIPDMDFTRPGSVDPGTIFAALDRTGPTTMFASPALLQQVGVWGRARQKKISGLKRVLSAGAPVAASVLRDFTACLPEGVQVHTPYGATESLPVCSIGSDEILQETGRYTEQGRGVCVGRPVPGLDLKIMRIADDAVPVWDDGLELANGETGEIVVRGPQVTDSYYNREQATRLAKIDDGAGGLYHRMGDLGYIDKSGRVWFCGRKSHRVESNGHRFFSVCCEGVFNRHDKVSRTALIGIQLNRETIPAICIELKHGYQRADKGRIVAELMELGRETESTAHIKHFFFHPAFPVDIRHNAKIGRERLSVWAQKQVT